MMARSLVASVDGLFRGRRDEAERQSAAALALARTLGARRFEAQTLGVRAMLELRDGQRERARRLVDEGLALCRVHGMGHIGPWLHGVRALAEADPDARSRWLDEGERQLALGSVSHNHVHLRETAIDALLEIGDLEGVERNCVRIESYTAQEPLPMSDWIVRRGRALARVARGERGDALAATLRALRDEGTRAEIVRPGAGPRRGDRAGRLGIAELNVACRSRLRARRASRLASSSTPTSCSTGCTSVTLAARRSPMPSPGIASAGSRARRCATRSSTCSSAAASARAGPRGRRRCATAGSAGRRWSRRQRARRRSRMRCTDADDQKFIDLALAARAVALLSADRAVLRLARRASAFGLVITTVAGWTMAAPP